MKMEQTDCFETSAYKIQTPGNYPEESIQHSEYGESLKSRTLYKLSHNVISIYTMALVQIIQRPVFTLHKQLKKKT
jgi:hypothetical protein